MSYILDSDVKLLIFGSLATGLALDSSDMDLAVTGLNIYDRSNIVESLQKLSTSLKSLRYVYDMKSIETASVPVIKMVKMSSLNLLELDKLKNHL
jgi:DNA polymerase sigma